MNNEDESWWKETIKDITPLKKISRDTFIPQKELKITPKITANTVYSGDKLGNLQFGNTDNIDANTAKKFRKGEFRVEAELDLHGCTENKAFDKVINFVKNSYLKQYRCVAIITGKGLHVTEESDIFSTRGVLKDRVPQWLNLPEIRPLILSINHPAPKDGGSGVIQILLRRHRG